MKTGSHSIDGTLSGINGEANFATTSFSLSSSQYITGYVYITGWLAGKHLEIHAMNGAVIQGIVVNIDDYVDETLFNIWQLFQIPLSDMNLAGSNITDIRIINENIVNTFYLDDIEIIGETHIGDGTSTIIIEYNIEPEKQTWFHINELKYSFVNNISADHVNGTMINLSYDQLVGETLPNGYIYQQINNNKVSFSSVIKNLKDLLQFPNTSIDSTLSDGVNTMVTICQQFHTPLILKSEDLDKLRILLQDDISGLLHMRIIASGFVEQRGL